MGSLNSNNNVLLYMQFAIVIILIIALVIIYVMTGQVNQELLSLASLGMGFFFGAETVDRIQKARMR